MAAANTGDTVRIHYTGKLKDGTVFDSSDGREPLEFTIGQNMIIPTLEAAVIGMNAGDTDTVEIGAEDAYGPHMPEAIQSVDRSMIPDEVELEIGV
jgi:peptidylprolyl isomerase